MGRPSPCVPPSPTEVTYRPHKDSFADVCQVLVVWVECQGEPTKVTKSDLISKRKILTHTFMN